jgi:hypothetical protein
MIFERAVRAVVLGEEREQELLPAWSCGAWGIGRAGPAACLELWCLGKGRAGLPCST